MSTQETKGAVFAYGENDHPADLLSSAAAVTRFISETAGSFSFEKNDLGLSEEGANGLVIILHGVENTINLAIERL
jgi:hypothetical protein